jgi:hypothetical protein
MKASAVLINIGRGPVVQEAPLLRALESGRIRARRSTYSKPSRCLPATRFIAGKPAALAALRRQHARLETAGHARVSGQLRALSQRRAAHNVINKELGY